MPPGRVIDSDEKSTEEEEEEDELNTSSGSDDTISVQQAGRQFESAATKEPRTVLINNPNDERHVVANPNSVRTPPDNPLNKAQVLVGGMRSQRQTTSDNKPANTGMAPSLQLSSAQLASQKLSGEGGAHLLHNHPNDERVVVEDEHNIPTPRESITKNDEPGGLILRNAPHDEAIPLSSQGSCIGTPSKLSSGRHGAMAPTDNDESTEDESEDMGSPSRGYNNQRPEAIDTETVVTTTVIPNLEYNPQDFAKINATASREMQELFKRILDYQPVIAELPAKLRPFIPDYVPSIGDLDPFCKIPRPDGRPDGLGIYILDEPSVVQANPAVVLLELRATNIHSSGGLAEVVDSFEDAANRPEVIDRWIADVKKVHCKKPLSTTNYQKPMPEIESLLQVWPSEFEEFLNSDTQFPPPHIDLDLDQYVRTLCCILDIPIYNSLIDPLHVMFTLYQEFRANQHFQHE